MWKLSVEELYGGAIVLFLLCVLSVKGSFPKLALAALAIFSATLFYAWKAHLWAPIDAPGWFPR